MTDNNQNLSDSAGLQDADQALEVTQQTSESEVAAARVEAKSAAARESSQRIRDMRGRIAFAVFSSPHR